MGPPKARQESQVLAQGTGADGGELGHGDKLGDGDQVPQRGLRSRIFHLQGVFFLCP